MFFFPNKLGENESYNLFRIRRRSSNVLHMWVGGRSNNRLSLFGVLEFEVLQENEFNIFIIKFLLNN